MIILHYMTMSCRTVVFPSAQMLNFNLLLFSQQTQFCGYWPPALAVAQLFRLWPGSVAAAKYSFK